MIVGAGVKNPFYVCSQYPGLKAGAKPYPSVARSPRLGVGPCVSEPLIGVGVKTPRVHGLQYPGLTACR